MQIHLNLSAEHSFAFSLYTSPPSALFECYCPRDLFSGDSLIAVRPTLKRCPEITA